MLCLASILLSHPYVVCVYGSITVTTGLSLVFVVRGGPRTTKTNEITQKTQYSIQHTATCLIHIVLSHHRQHSENQHFRHQHMLPEKQSMEH